MRTEDEVLKAVIDQVLWGINRLGWDGNDLGECVNMAMDMVMTDDEAMTYTNMSYLVKTTIVY